jgi:hypothetical protein
MNISFRAQLTEVKDIIKLNQADFFSQPNEFSRIEMLNRNSLIKQLYIIITEEAIISSVDSQISSVRPKLAIEYTKW